MQYYDFPFDEDSIGLLVNEFIFTYKNDVYVYYFSSDEPMIKLVNPYIMEIKWYNPYGLHCPTPNMDAEKCYIRKNESKWMKFEQNKIEEVKELPVFMLKSKEEAKREIQEFYDQKRMEESPIIKKIKEFFS